MVPQDTVAQGEGLRLVRPHQEPEKCKISDLGSTHFYTWLTCAVSLRTPQGCFSWLCQKLGCRWGQYIAMRSPGPSCSWCLWENQLKSSKILYTCLLFLSAEATGPLYFYLFIWTGIWTQGFILAKQALYHLSHAASSFCSGYFGDGDS
jgi:hypothetical protein